MSLVARMKESAKVQSGGGSSKFAFTYIPDKKGPNGEEPNLVRRVRFLTGFEDVLEVQCHNIYQEKDEGGWIIDRPCVTVYDPDAVCPFCKRYARGDEDCKPRTCYAWPVFIYNTDAQPGDLPGYVTVLYWEFHDRSPLSDLSRWTEDPDNFDDKTGIADITAQDCVITLNIVKGKKSYSCDVSRKVTKFKYEGEIEIPSKKKMLKTIAISTDPRLIGEAPRGNGKAFAKDAPVAKAPAPSKVNWLDDEEDEKPAKRRAAPVDDDEEVVVKPKRRVVVEEEDEKPKRSTVQPPADEEDDDDEDEDIAVLVAKMKEDKVKAKVRAAATEAAD